MFSIYYRWPINTIFQVLADSCTKFVIDHLEITFETLPSILEFAIQNYNLNLQWMCLIFAYENNESKELKNILEESQKSIDSLDQVVKDETLSEKDIEAKRENLIKYQEILQMGDKCKKSSITPYFHPAERYRMMAVDYLPPDPEYKELIEAGRVEFGCMVDLSPLRKAYSLLEGIKLNVAFFYNSGQQDILIKAFRSPQLKYFEAQEYSQGIFCMYSPGLKTLIANECPYMQSNECQQLEIIQASMVHNMTCDDCPKLKKLDVNRAKTVGCANCPELESIHVSEVETLYCSKSKVITLDLPKVQLLRCQNCPYLTTVEAKNVKFIDITGSKNLTRLVVGQNTDIEGELPKNCELIRV